MAISYVLGNKKLSEYVTVSKCFFFPFLKVTDSLNNIIKMEMIRNMTQFKHSKKNGGYQYISIQSHQITINSFADSF